MWFCWDEGFERNPRGLLIHPGTQIPNGRDGREERISPLWSRIHVPIKRRDRDRTGALAWKSERLLFAGSLRAVYRKGKCLTTKDTGNNDLYAFCRNLFTVQKMWVLAARVTAVPVSCRKNQTNGHRIQLLMKYSYGYMFRSREVVIGSTLDQLKRKGVLVSSYAICTLLLNCSKFSLLKASRSRNM